MVKRTPAALELLLVEERGYAPFRWQTIRYSLAGESLEPEIADVAKQAQIRAFCRSFLEHFPRRNGPRRRSHGSSSRSEYSEVCLPNDANMLGNMRRASHAFGRSVRRHRRHAPCPHRRRHCLD